MIKHKTSVLIKLDEYIPKVYKTLVTNINTH